MLSENHDKSINAGCLACALPLVKLAAMVRLGSPGDVFEAVSDSPGFLDDVKLWCLRTGHTLLVSHSHDPAGTTVIVQKR